ncbi:hypothetical protein LZ30DRAFT_746609 [Colletotrichum cereale]|nr:hypothetical protein LZ30DRAFT_746609 [Colletotrichum cereale]
MLLVPDVKPRWTVFGSNVLGIPRKTPILCKLANRDSVLAHSDGKRLVIQDGSLSVYSTTVGSGEDCASPDVCGYDSGDLGPSGIDRNHGHGGGGRTGAVSRSLGTDATHLMRPFTGEGVNVALKDALKLAGAITSAAHEGNRIDLLVQKRLTEELMHDFVSTSGAPGTIITASITRLVKCETPLVLHPLAAGMVHSSWRISSEGLVE